MIIIIHLLHQRPSEIVMGLEEVLFYTRYRDFLLFIPGEA
jgi:hypothetical protein